MLRLLPSMIIYELNPPKIARQGSFDRQRLDADMQAVLQRACQLEGLVDGIHLTDSVLGIPRVSSITAAGFLANSLDLQFSCSLRTSDRNYTSLCQAAVDAIMLDVESLLVLMGDAPADGRHSGLKPSLAVKMLKDEGYDANIHLDLSFPARIIDKSAPAIQNKVAARPHAFVTQSIASLSDLGEIVDLARPNGIKVVACIMTPSEKNLQSAKIIGLDWSQYEKNPVDFIKNAAKIADGVLLTSPNSFKSGLEILKQI